MIMTETHCFRTIPCWVRTGYSITPPKGRRNSWAPCGAEKGVGRRSHGLAPVATRLRPFGADIWLADARNHGRRFSRLDCHAPALLFACVGPSFSLVHEPFPPKAGKAARSGLICKRRNRSKRRNPQTRDCPKEPSAPAWPPPNKSSPLPSEIPSRSFSRMPPKPQSS